MDLVHDEWIADIRSGNDRGVCHREPVPTRYQHDRSSLSHIAKEGSPSMRFGMVMWCEFDEESVLADIGRDAFQLERLEPGPLEKPGVRRGEPAQVFRHVLVGLG